MYRDNGNKHLHKKISLLCSYYNKLYYKKTAQELQNPNPSIVNYNNTTQPLKYLISFIIAFVCKLKIILHTWTWISSLRFQYKVHR